MDPSKTHLKLRKAGAGTHAAQHPSGPQADETVAGRPRPSHGLGHPKRHKTMGVSKNQGP